jgi:transcriptional regulator with AAA-type ATPase domain
MGSSGAHATRTEEDLRKLMDGDGVGAPGLVLVFAAGRPVCQAFLVTAAGIELGRQPRGDGITVDDGRVSRHHARVSFSGGKFRVTDLRSRNGTFVDGVRVEDRVFEDMPRLLRVGHALFLFVRDVLPYLRGGVEVRDGVVVGPHLRRRHEQIGRAAAAGESVLFSGESGVGKEFAAQAYHAATRRNGPLVPVNCATLPAGLAEALLFGARRGSYTGATRDIEGYVRAAQGGTLFLDEIGDLDIQVQPKLLRMLAEGEIFELGSARARQVDVRVCAATLKDLRAEIAAGRFRDDLYYRICQPQVRIPRLTERLEELPYHVVTELARMDRQLVPSALFLEACALRVWPGNIRELLLEVRQSARAVLEDGRVVLEAEDLSAAAGQPLVPDSAPTPRSGDRQRRIPATAIEEALLDAEGNVTAAARKLGIHRNQIRRLIQRYGIDWRRFRPERADDKKNGDADKNGSSDDGNRDSDVDSDDGNRDSDVDSDDGSNGSQGNDDGHGGDL